MEETPTVSVVAVCYNHSRFVREALDSIKRQAWPKLQLIFCDDASQDSSVEIASHWLSQNAPDAVRILHSLNQGLLSTLNEALAVAQGKYIQILACDDLLRCDAIASRVSKLEGSDPQVIMCCGNFDRIDED